MNVNYLLLPGLQNGEHFMFMSEVSHVIETNDPTTIDLVNNYIQFNRALQGEDIAYKKVQKSSITKDLNEKDSERDNLLRSFRSLVSSSQQHFNKDKAAAAYRLILQIDAYGNLSAQSYENETANVYNLLQDLESKHSADIATLGLGAWITEIETVNKDFDQLMKSRYSESAEQAEIGSLRDARLETDKAYNAMKERLNAAIIFNGEDKYRKTVTELNVIIKRYNDIIARRKGSSKAK